jgi:hypothetical protein
MKMQAALHGASHGSARGGVRDDATFANVLRDAAASKNALSSPSLHDVTAPASFRLHATPRALPISRPDAGQKPLALINGRSLAPPEPRERRLRKSAQQLVGTALLMPVLEQMDQSSLQPRSGPFARNIAEQRFGPMLHQHMADRIMQSRSFGLVDAVVHRLGGEGSRTEVKK